MTDPIAPLNDWFAQQGWSPFSFQHAVWRAYLDGESGMIHSPTGSGKTYAAWLGPLAEWLSAPDPDWKSTKRQPHPPLRVLWITPLRALAADTARNLEAAVAGLGVPWSVETRTSSTKSSVRNRQRKRLPTALVTTPESLSLMLSWPQSRDLFRDLRCVVVDEWHEFLSNKRGVQVELGLARLRRWHPNLRTWGLSATVGNLPTARDVLLGQLPDSREPNAGRLIEGDLTKELAIHSVIPDKIERFPWAGHMGLKLLPQLVEIVAQHKTSLIFCNTRNQVEQWYQALTAYPEIYPVALHHSSIEEEKRAWVEDGLRSGRLKCVVCTSSLDLGVDFPPSMLFSK